MEQENKKCILMVVLLFLVLTGVAYLLVRQSGSLFESSPAARIPVAIRLAENKGLAW